MIDDEFGLDVSTDPADCPHPSASGIDDAEGPSKVWECDACHFLHHIIPDPGRPGAVKIVPAGSLLPDNETPAVLRLPTAIARNLTEAQFQSQVMRVAKRHGWLVCHVYPCIAGGKTRTPTSYKGFPDLTLIRRGEGLFLELKAVDGTATPEQRRWIATAQTVPGFRAYIVDPRDWPEVHAILTAPRQTA